MFAPQVIFTFCPTVLHLNMNFNVCTTSAVSYKKTPTKTTRKLSGFMEPHSTFWTLARTMNLSFWLWNHITPTVPTKGPVKWMDKVWPRPQRGCLLCRNDTASGHWQISWRSRCGYRYVARSTVSMLAVSKPISSGLLSPEAELLRHFFESVHSVFSSNEYVQLIFSYVYSWVLKRTFWVQGVTAALDVVHFDTSALPQNVTVDIC